MYIQMMVNECDYSGKVFQGYTMGAGVLAQGATGRWCVVMTVGPDELTRMGGVKTLTREEAEAKAMDILKEQNLLRPEHARYQEDELGIFIDF